MLRLAALPALLLLAACGGDPAPAPAAAPTSAPAAATSAPAAQPSPSTQPDGRPAQVRLAGDGIDLPEQLLEFGAPFDQARTALTDVLGTPSTDTGETESFSTYGTCPGTTLRALEFGDGALVVLFGDVDGPDLTMYSWSLMDEGDPARVPQASAFVGDVTTYDFGVGVTLAQLREGTGEMLSTDPAEGPFPDSFRIEDQSAGLDGYLDGPQDSARVTYVHAGRPCGE